MTEEYEDTQEIIEDSPIEGEDEIEEDVYAAAGPVGEDDDFEDLSVDEEEELDDDSEEDEAAAAQYTTPLDKLFFITVKRNAGRRESKLRVHLPAPVVIRISQSSESFTIDWSKEEIQVAKGFCENPACTLELTEEHLLDIADGSLNPQVAMLSDKIQIVGDMEAAMYVFNLFAQRGRRR